MKRSHFITFIILIIITTFIVASIINIYKERNREGIILSPSKYKSVEISDSLGTTQILMNFHKYFIVGGSNVAYGEFDKNKAEFEWQDENNLIIRLPSNAVLRSKETKVQFFQEIVNIKYEEIE